MNDCANYQLPTPIQQDKHLLLHLHVMCARRVWASSAVWPSLFVNNNYMSCICFCFCRYLDFKNHEGFEFSSENIFLFLPNVSQLDAGQSENQGPTWQFCHREVPSQTNTIMLHNIHNIRKNDAGQSCCQGQDVPLAFSAFPCYPLLVFLVWCPVCPFLFVLFCLCVYVCLCGTLCCWQSTCTPEVRPFI